jgi:hypothetical protein
VEERRLIYVRPMADAGAKASGSCFCGAIRFTAEMPTIFCGHCHCSMCRRSHGAGYVTWFAVPRGQFLLGTGEAQLVRFRSSDHGTRSFCGRCGSTLFCETTHYPDMVDIVLANMVDPIDRAPQARLGALGRRPPAPPRTGLGRLTRRTGSVVIAGIAGPCEAS